MEDQNEIADFGAEGEEFYAQASVEPQEQYDFTVADPAYDPSASASDQAEAVMCEAIKRIEQANLYQTILRHDLFGPGSARPEIIELVQREFRDFALMRMEILLGMKDTPQAAQPVTVKAELPFDDEQIDFLRQLADRGMKRNAAPVAHPQLVQVTSQPQAPVQAPMINRVQVSAPKVQQVAPVATKPVVRPQPRKQAAVPTTPLPPVANPKATQPGKPRRRRSNNVSQVKDDHGNVISSKDYSQAVPEGAAANRRKPMPSQSEMNMMAAASAARNQSAMGKDSMLNTALMSALANAAKLPDNGE